MQSLRVRLLGDLHVEGCEPAALGRRQQRTLLKIMALHHGRPVRVDHLVECLWGAAAPARSADQISVLVSRLRGLVGAERVGRTDAGYRLEVDWLDLDALGELAGEAGQRLEQGNLVAARTAAAAGLALCRGELLADEPDPWWATAESAAVAQSRQRLRHVALVASSLSLDWAESDRQARDLLATDPFDEVALRSLMTALAATGRAASALATYAAFRELLADELGVSPEPETEDLHSGILRGTFAGGADQRRPHTARPRRALPGRSAALEQLDASLEVAAAGRCVLCVVEGEAGMGKTRLLREWTGTLREHAVSVAFVTADELGHGLPLQPVLDLVAALAVLSERGGNDGILGPDALVLSPFLGLHPAPTEPAHLAGLTEPGAGQGILQGAATGAVRRAANRRPVVLVVDDAHLADRTTVQWIAHAPLQLADAPVLVVASVRSEERVRLPGADVIVLEPLDLSAASDIVGPARAPELWARSNGNPLLLTELAAWEPTMTGAANNLPESLRRSVEDRCARAGEAAATLRTAAVIGPAVDLGLLAGVTGSDPATLLDHLEEGVRRRFLDERGPHFVFAHALVREILASSVGASRTAFIHRQAARALATRPFADPLAAARHARLGGDLEAASSMLTAAARIAVARFDADEALRLLNEAIALHDCADTRVERARVLTMLGRNDETTGDLEAARALGAGPEVLEVAAWSAHFQRQFGEALLLADQGARDADSDELRTSCLSLGGWVSLVTGDLARAETRLEGAVASAPSGGAALAESWLAWLRASQGRPDETIALVHISDGTGLARYRYPNAYALMAATMALAMVGRADQALAAVALLEAAVERMDAARWGPRARNLKGWILRNLGEPARADDLNHAAVEESRRLAMAEPLAHGLLDLAAGRLQAGDPGGAARYLHEAQLLEDEDHAFRWRHQLRRRLLQARHDLSTSDLESAVAATDTLAADAAMLGVLRHEVQARLLGAVARRRADLPCDREEVEAMLLRLDGLAGLEAWWITAEVAQSFAVPSWVTLAARRVSDLAATAGPLAPSLRRAAAATLDA